MRHDKMDDCNTFFDLKYSIFLIILNQKMSRCGKISSFDMVGFVRSANVDDINEFITYFNSKGELALLELLSCYDGINFGSFYELVRKIAYHIGNGTYTIRYISDNFELIVKDRCCSKYNIDVIFIIFNDDSKISIQEGSIISKDNDIPRYIKNIKIDEYRELLNF